MPLTKVVMGYGSGFLAQQGYDYTSTTGPQLDLVLAVDNLYDFHRQNLLQNPTHYSLLIRLLGSRLGAHLLDYVQRTMVPVVYNPFVQLGTF